MSYQAKTFVGLSVLGHLVGPDPDLAARSMASVLVGQYDEELKCVVHSQHFGTFATCAEDLEKPPVEEMLQRIKSNVRLTVQGIFEAAAQADADAKREQLAKTLNELKGSGKKHEWGTVAEIAAMYNVSKSEVRRRKANGTLEELRSKLPKASE